MIVPHDAQLEEHPARRDLRTASLEHQGHETGRASKRASNSNSNRAHKTVLALCNVLKECGKVNTGFCAEEMLTGMSC